MMIRTLMFATGLLAILGFFACGEGHTEEYTDISDEPDVSHEGKATVPIEARAYMADVVVKARLVSASDDVLTFNSVQYMKGTGPKRFTVKADTDGRDTRWDNQDAILFLSTLDGDEDFEFIDTAVGGYNPLGYGPGPYTGNLPEGYTVNSRNPVWLPVGSSGASVARSASQTSSGDVVTEYDSVGNPRTISQRQLQDRVAWVQGPSEGPAGDSSSRATRNTPSNGQTVSAEDYEKCILSALDVLTFRRDWAARWGEEEARIDESVGSGLGHGQTILDFTPQTPFLYVYSPTIGYDEHIIYGQDSELFQINTSDDDSIPENGYIHTVTTLRPLPAGTYRFKHENLAHIFKACDFRDDYYVLIVVEVTAPPGTVHEAFFDLATTTAGVGYLATTSTSTGVLEPAGFSVGGRAITITGLTWRDGRVVLTLDRFGSWLDGFSFIEPDGTVGLRLAEVDATKDWAARTLTWEVSEQPWESGDELMMRMGPIPLPGVRNLTAEANSAGEAVLRWEVAYRAGVSGYRIWRHRPGRDEGPRIYVSDTLSTDTTYTDANSPVPNLTEYRVQAIDRIYNAGESSESVRVSSQ